MVKQNTSSLGRGLSSLIPQKGASQVESGGEQTLDEGVLVPVRPTGDNPIVTNRGEQLKYIPIHLISANPMQPRAQFDNDALDELANSIKEQGILQPLVVTVKEDGRYELVMGERRLRAAKRAGLNTVPAIVREASEQQKLELALIENIMREDLNPVELAVAYEKYLQEFELTHEDAARRLGKSRSNISNTLRLLQLPDEIKSALREGRLSAAHAKIIVGLPNVEQQLDMYKRVVERGLSINRMRVEIQKVGGTKEARLKVYPQDEEMQKKLRQFLGTRVSIQRSGYKGKILIDFFNYDEMVEIVNKILNNN
ncbi:MAG: ParB/RepB/Spo0J family partition protein [Patescibacteria group bacterium]